MSWIVSFILILSFVHINRKYLSNDTCESFPNYCSDQKFVDVR